MKEFDFNMDFDLKSEEVRVKESQTKFNYAYVVQGFETSKYIY